MLFHLTMRTLPSNNIFSLSCARKSNTVTFAVVVVGLLLCLSFFYNFLKERIFWCWGAGLNWSGSIDLNCPFMCDLPLHSPVPQRLVGTLRKLDLCSKNEKHHCCGSEVTGLQVCRLFGHLVTPVGTC